ncbi:hypothetical protein PIIN_11294 [Serendipita indica DSM 11827]|uniref:Uncharacterized protein n=1 Tax=Serendipita indica (strain DSM 11827) TaxID=1109443 RepID=G4U174_SERID|nr:hypothetical protein PIIN_11294 [Serendipita indica DSM 11827]
MEDQKDDSNPSLEGLPSDLLQTKIFRIPGYPASWPAIWTEQEWPLLKVIITTVATNRGLQSYGDLSRLLLHAPNLKALACMGRYWADPDASGLPTARFFTIPFATFPWLGNQTLGRFGKCGRGDTMVMSSSPGTLYPGGIDEANFEGLIPFLRRHTATVTDFVERIAIQMNNDAHQPPLIQYFDNIKVYGANRWFDLEAEQYPRQDLSKGTLPLTFLSSCLRLS